jgi:branched-chain amino acid transport system permease protein
MLGSSYALIAVGYTLVFGVLNLLNLAHGDIFMFAGYIGLFLIATVSLPLWAAVLGAMIGAGLLSLLLWLVCFRPAKQQEFDLAPVLSTIGFGIMLQQIAVRIWGSEATPVPAGLEPVNFQVGSVLISSVQLASLGIALLLMLVLGIVLARTGFGRAMRAVSENPEVAGLLGVNTRRIVVLTFLVSGMLAGVAGILVTLRTGSVSPTIGLSIGLKGLAVMVIGGLGNFHGAVVAGLLLGMLEVLAIAYWSASYADLVVWGTLIVVLLVKPTGLFGLRTQVERA